MINDFYNPIKDLLEPSEKRIKKKKTLLASFECGQAVNWCFNVGTWARSPLAIHFSDVTVKKIKTKQWRQGSNFNFITGTAIPSDKLKYPTIVQITEATPAGFIQTQSGFEHETGHIKFDTFSKISDTYIKIGSFETTQVDFIYLLYSGRLVSNGTETKLLETAECQKHLDLITQKLKTEKSTNSSEYVQASLLTEL